MPRESPGTGPVPRALVPAAHRQSARGGRYCGCVRYFNTSGPCVPGEHYMLAPEPRLPEARALIEQRRFLGVHAPRQTGKTTTLAALAADLTAEGRFAAVRFSCETARTAPDDGIAEDRILGAIRLAARSTLTPELQPPPQWPDATPGSRLRDGLFAWAGQCPLP